MVEKIWPLADRIALIHQEISSPRSVDLSRLMDAISRRRVSRRHLGSKRHQELCKDCMAMAMVPQRVMVIVKRMAIATEVVMSPLISVWICCL